MAKDNYNHISDNDLLDHYRNDGNNQWLGIFLERYTLLLFGVCMKYLKNEEEAKDAVQQVFVKAIQELGKYPIYYPKSWLYKVACNHCLMKIRDKKTTVSLEHTGFEESIEPTAETPQLKEQNLIWLEQSLPSLQTDQRTCVTLFYLEKKSYQEISMATGLSLLQVKSHIQNGKRNLRILIDKKRKDA
ncbi:MAG: RNA polymerase sigma factor [Sediminibacterium sp.]|nr:sigma-70 family RNA polymerase sigma factor [Chitinophagaceae bacterium]MCA6448503.1 sigma-70 family RNA polymerase sigma factor [Chitinophagaceae bacterium]